MITISPAPLQGRASLLEPLLLPEKAVLRQPPTAPSHRSGECKNMPAFNSKLSGNLQSLEFIRAGDAYSSLIHPHPGPTQVTGSASCQDSGLSNWLLGLLGTHWVSCLLPPPLNSVSCNKHTYPSLFHRTGKEAENLYLIIKGFCCVVVLGIKVSLLQARKGGTVLLLTITAVTWRPAVSLSPKSFMTRSAMVFMASFYFGQL